MARTTPRSVLPPMRERDLQALVRQACGLYRWTYFHPWTSVHSPAGYPDVTAVRRERLIFAELKRQGQPPTPAQQQWLDALAQVTQVECYVWTPADVDTLLELLR